MKNIPALEGIRGYACLWILCHHLIEMLSVTISPSLGIILNPLSPLLIFFILSGFVMSLLIDAKKEAYRQYIFRRYFRLAPTLLIICLIYFACLPVILPVLKELLPQRVSVFTSAYEHFFIQLLAKLTLLYGLLVPWVPNASASFVPPAWSVSVEWQFYLLAPLFAFCFGKGIFLRVFFIFFAMTLAQMFLGISVVFVGKYLLYILIGMLTYYAVDPYQTKVHNKRYALIAMAVILFMKLIILTLTVNAIQFLSLTLPLLMWAGFIFVIFFVQSSKGKMLKKKVFENKPMVFIGKMSYSFYLLHMLAMYFTLYVLLPFQSSMGLFGFFSVTLAVTILINLLISWLSFKLLELPSMKFSAKWGKKLFKPKAVLRASA